MSITQSDRMLTRTEAAMLLGIKAHTLATWAMTGKNIPFIKVGGKSVRYRESDIMRYIERRTIGGGDPSAQ